MPLKAQPILCADRIGIFYFRFFLFLSRKASNAITNIPTATIKEATAKIVETISYAVIGATSLPMYKISREATTPS